MRERKGSLSVQNSIQTRLSFVMALVMVFVVCINFFIFEQIHTGVDRIDAVFSSNAAINDLSDTLNKLEGTVYEYLNIKGTKALENYYRYEQDYRELLDKLNDRNVDNEVKMLEKNIRRMSESYLNQTSETVQAKRGRNIEKYKASYEKELQLYKYINSYIYKLNNLRFRMNSSNYQLLLSSMDVLYRLALVVIFIVAAVGVAIIILFVQSMIRPLTQLSSTAHEVALGNLNVPILPVVCEDEVGVVTRSFNQMLDSIRIHGLQTVSLKKSKILFISRTAGKQQQFHNGCEASESVATYHHKKLYNFYFKEEVVNESKESYGISTLCSNGIWFSSNNCYGSSGRSV